MQRCGGAELQPPARSEANQTGGAAGNAVVLNGNTVTWSGGNTATQVRGPVN